MSLSETLSFIRLEATAADLESVHEAIKAARGRIQSQTVAQLRAGQTVSLSGLSPKYLNGLSGEVVNVRGTRVDILLDESSTNRVRGTKHGPFEFARSLPGDKTEPVTRHRLTGIPAQCATIRETVGG